MFGEEKPNYYRCVENPEASNFTSRLVYDAYLITSTAGKKGEESRN